MVECFQFVICITDTYMTFCFSSMMDLESPDQVETPEREWTTVPAGSTVPFSFEGRGKQRHRDTHELKVHQLLVHVEGWQEVGPVTVDKVGVFFRVASPDPQIPPTQVNPLTPLFLIISDRHPYLTKDP